MTLPLKYHYMWEDSNHDIEKFVEEVSRLHEDEVDQLHNELEKFKIENAHYDSMLDDAYASGYEDGYDDYRSEAKHAVLSALEAL